MSLASQGNMTLLNMRAQLALPGLRVSDRDIVIVPRSILSWLSIGITNGLRCGTWKERREERKNGEAAGGGGEGREEEGRKGEGKRGTEFRKEMEQERKHAQVYAACTTRTCGGVSHTPARVHKQTLAPIARFLTHSDTDTCPKNAEDNP